MPITITRYLLRQFFSWIALIIPALGFILLAFDVLANADEVLEHHDQIIWPLLNYMALRIPPILSLIIPMAALLASMVTLARMAMRSEMIALRSVTGLSVYRLAGLIMIGGGVILCLHFLLANFILPDSASRFSNWSAQDFRGLPEAPKDEQHFRNWIAYDNMLIRVESSAVNGTELSKLEIVQRNENHVIQRIITAEKAQYVDGQWILSDTTPPLGVLNELGFTFTLPPSAFKTIDKREPEISYGTLARMIETNAVKTGLENQHTTWLHYKITHPLSTLIMILLTVPISLQLARRNTMMRSALIIIIAGFGYFILERLMLSLGESGNIPALLATWAPLGLVGMGGLWILLWLEG